jgi:DNA-binding GntR family transcriptional regulator
LGKNPESNQNKRTAEPIKNIDDFKRVRSVLAGNPRDLLLFDLAVQTGIGMKKILRMKVKDIAGIKIGEKLSLASNDGHKYYVIMTEPLYETLNRYLEEVRPNLEDYLIKSKKGQRPLNLSTVSNMINGWFKAANIKNCYGAISLRKTYEFKHKDKTRIDQDATEAQSTSNPTFIFKPLESTTVQRRIFKELFKAIISRKIPPGARLTTDEISRAFKVSQAPVRVAMNWLEARGFIVSQRKKGSIVRELTTDELHEIVQVRLILETAAAKLAYKVCTEETLNQLEFIIERYKKAYTFEESDQINKQFHRTIYQDINMPLLIRIIIDLYDRFSPYAALAFADLSFELDQNIKREGPAYYHTKILEGLRRKDIDKVLKYLEMKLRRGMLMTEEIMKQSERIDAIG